MISFSRLAVPFLCLVAIAYSVSGLVIPVLAQQKTQELAKVPGVWRGNIHVKKPDLIGLDKLTFYTSTGYPPFNYYDEEGNLTGFNVDLAKAICDVLAVECVVRVEDWDNLIPALNAGKADGIMASMRITTPSVSKSDFTDTYYSTPARFVGRVKTKAINIAPERIKGIRIGVVTKTAHEAYLRDFFNDATIIPFGSSKGARAALMAGNIDLLFGDGVSMVFWLNGSLSNGCCEFRGGNYLESRYFGSGVGIAVKKRNRRMRHILNYGLNQLRSDGRYEELFRRYFPLSFY